jgi:hypothetical protein
MFIIWSAAYEAERFTSSDEMVGYTEIWTFPSFLAPIMTVTEVSDLISVIWAKSSL